MIKKTLAEQLDAAETDEDFGNVIQGLFKFIEKKMEEEDGSA